MLRVGTHFMTLCVYFSSRRWSVSHVCSHAERGSKYAVLTETGN